LDGEDLGVREAKPVLSHGKSGGLIPRETPASDGQRNAKCSATPLADTGDRRCPHQRLSSFHRRVKTVGAVPRRGGRARRRTVAGISAVAEQHGSEPRVSPCAVAGDEDGPQAHAMGGGEGRAKRARRGLALRPSRSRVERPDACAATGSGRREGKEGPRGPCWRDGSPDRSEAALHPREGPGGIIGGDRRAEGGGCTRKGEKLFLGAREHKSG
jgi:hypothetical protein